MMQQALVQPGVAQAPVAVFGIEVSDPTLTSKVKAVVIVSVILAIWNIGWGILTIAGGAGVFSLVCAVCVPACGFFGAKQKNRELLCAFWGCNACAMAFNACAMVSLLLVGGALAAVSKYGLKQTQDCCTKLENCSFAATDCYCAVLPHTGLCQGDCAGMVYVPEANHQLCPANNVTGIVCLEPSTCTGLAKLPAAAGFILGAGALILTIPCVLATVACVCGFQLYSHPTFGRTVVVHTQYPVAAATVVTAVQPPPMK